MRSSFPDLRDKRLDIPRLGTLGVLEEVVRGTVAGGLAGGEGLCQGLPDDKEENAGGLPVQGRPGQPRLHPVHPLARQVPVDLHAEPWSSSGHSDQGGSHLSP